MIIRELLDIQTTAIPKLLKARYRRFRYVGSRAPFLGGVFSRQVAGIQRLLQGSEPEEEGEEETDLPETENGDFNSDDATSLAD